MTEARVPVLLCHLELCVQILGEVTTLRREIVSHGAASARDLIDAVLPGLIANHVATADTVSEVPLRSAPFRALAKSRRPSPAGLSSRKRQSLYLQAFGGRWMPYE
jgi:hypothetical protein